MLVLTDVGNVGDAHDRLEHWIEDGGVLVRFAGPRLAASDDDLVPVKLRRGGRILGGSLSWDNPAACGVFARGPVQWHAGAERRDRQPAGPCRARRRADGKHLATLADGTPLVTAARRGKGLIVLFHVTGDPRWSDLPLSGTFVEMLKRIVALAGTTAAAETDNTRSKNVRETLPPSHILDGFGSFTATRRRPGRCLPIMPAARRPNTRAIRTNQ